VRQLSFTAVLRQYCNKRGDWVCYRNKLHSPDDEKDFDGREALDQILEGIGAQDGDEIKITVEVTGRKVTGRWMLTEPHVYSFVPDEVEDEDGP